MSLAPAAPTAADPHLDHRPVRDHRDLHRPQHASTRRRSRRSSSTRTRCSCWPRSSSSTRASRCAAIAGSCCCAAPAFESRPRDSTEIIFLSWLVNCVVPAKLGDVYRAYLLKINSTASLSRTFGTVFIERVLDLFAIAILGIAAGLLELPRRPAAGRSSWSSRSASSSSSSSPSVFHDAQLRAPDHRRAAAAAPGPRAVRPVRGRRLRRRRGAAAAGARSS